MTSRRSGPRRAAEGGRPGAGEAAGREEAAHVTKEDRGGRSGKGINRPDTEAGPTKSWLCQGSKKDGEEPNVRLGPTDRSERAGA